MLEGVEIETVAIESFPELLPRDVHSRTHLRIGVVDLGVAEIDSKLFSFLDLVLVVREFVDHVLPYGWLVRAHKVQLVRCSISSSVMDSPFMVTAAD